MTKQSRFSTLLVPTDFSAASREAFDWALDYADGDDAVVIVLHVIDDSFLDLIATHQLGDVEVAISRMREHSEQQLGEYQPSNNTQVDTIVSVGIPFVEIISKAEDFVVDAIVMAKVGSREHFEKLLFGSTAEKVLRASRRPVIVLPVEEHKPHRKIERVSLSGETPFEEERN